MVNTKLLYGKYSAAPQGRNQKRFKKSFFYSWKNLYIYNVNQLKQNTMKAAAFVIFSGPNGLIVLDNFLAN